MRFSSVCLFAAVATPLFAPAFVSAVQPSGGEAISTTTWAPGEVSAWDYVGSIGQATGVFLGNYDGSYWVLTATHVGSGAFKLGDYSYSAVNGSLVQLEGAYGNLLQPDLVMYRIDAGSGAKLDYLNSLPLLEIGETTLAIGSEVRLIGNGDGNSSAVTKSWGDNTLAGVGYFNISYNSTTYQSASYYTLDSAGVRAVTGDSGGGAFYWTGTGWALVGIMNAIASDINEEGPGTAVIALGVYADQILTVIPEPGTLAALSALLALGSVLVGRRRSN